MPQKYRIRLRGQEKGEATLEEIRQQLESGSLDRWHKFSADGANWMDYEQLCAAAAQSSAPPVDPAPAIEVAQQTQAVSSTQPHSADNPDPPPAASAAPTAAPVPPTANRSQPPPDAYYLDNGRKRIGPLTRAKVLDYIARDRADPDWLIEREGGARQRTLREVFPIEIADMEFRREEVTRLAEEERHRQEEMELAIVEAKEEQARVHAEIEEARRRKPAAFESVVLSVIWGFGVTSAMALMIVGYEMLIAKQESTRLVKGGLIFGLIAGTYGLVSGLIYWFAIDFLNPAASQGPRPLVPVIPLILGTLVVGAFIGWKRAQETWVQVLNIIFVAAGTAALLTMLVAIPLVPGFADLLEGLVQFRLPEQAVEQAAD